MGVLPIFLLTVDENCDTVGFDRVRFGSYLHLKPTSAMAYGEGAWYGWDFKFQRFPEHAAHHVQVVIAGETSH